MAFDLNKNDGSATGSSDKTSASSKFNLSKKETVSTSEIIVEPTPKSKNWIIGLVGILIVGGGIWYYTSRPKTEEIVKTTSTEVVPSDSTAVDATVTPAKAEGGVAVTDTTVAAPSGVQTAAQTPAVEGTTVVPVSASSRNEVVAKLNNKIPATFNQGSSSIKQLDRSLIRRITTYLAKNPTASIHVNGYASSDGSLEINQTISQARADAFKRYLITKSVAENRVVAVGKGIENPIASNNTNAGRKKNRRVEITFP